MGGRWLGPPWGSVPRPIELKVASANVRPPYTYIYIYIYAQVKAILAAQPAMAKVVVQWQWIHIKFGNENRKSILHHSTPASGVNLISEMTRK